MSEDAPDPLAQERMEFMLMLRRRGIKDPRVLRAMDLVPRERFVEADQADIAYADQALPISCGQTISQPYVVAAMTEALEVEPHHKVLEVGTGSGYQAAVLAHLAEKVVSIERYQTLADSARERLEALGLNNVIVIAGDGAQGAPEHAPFDRIMITAAATEIPRSLLDQLVDGGVIVAPVGPRGGVQSLIRFHKQGDRLEQRELMAVRFVPLVTGKAAAS
jgi:protein-L-isoaspartate(D-aspartate) O-methyltransferase